MKTHLVSLPFWFALAALAAPASSFAQTTTERHSFSLALTGFANGAYTGRYTTNRGVVTVRHQQPMTTFRFGNADLIAAINEVTGGTNTPRAVLWIDDEEFVIAERGVTNRIPFCDQLRVEVEVLSWAERFSDTETFNELTEETITETESGSGRATLEVTIVVGRKFLTLFGAVNYSWQYQYRTGFESETIRETGRVIGNIGESDDGWENGGWEDDVREVFPVEGTFTISSTRTTRWP